MGRFIDLKGKVFGRLTVLKHIGSDKRGASLWRCRCACGKEKVLRAGNIGSNTLSCGCYRKEQSTKRFKTHGMDTTPIYIVWIEMRKRCNNPNVKFFKDYGGRGIKVCKRWDRFENFYADMGDRPEGMSLDRINNAGNYKPSNCRWANRLTQANNTRGNRILTFDGISMTLAEWSRKIAISQSTLCQRLNLLGWSIQRALTEPVKLYKRGNK